MAETTESAPLALPPVAEPPRPRTLLLGTAFATGAVLMCFAGLFGVYIAERSAALAAGEEWIPEGAIQLVPGGMMMATLVMSVVTVQWAVNAIANDDRGHAVLALVVTALLGAAVVNQQAFYWRDMGLPIDASVAALLVWVITGAFMAMLLAGLVFLALVAFRAFAGQYSSRQADGIKAAAIFWDAMVLVYFVIWYAIYITK